MRRILIIGCLLLAWCDYSFAMLMPSNSPPRNISLLSGSVLRDDIDRQRSLHDYHGVEFSYRFLPHFSVASMFSFSWDNNYQARESFLDENLYGFHLIGMASYAYLFRFTIGCGPS